MGIYGYHRTSTQMQHLDRGIKEIETYCQSHNLNLEKIYVDQCTGKNFYRPRYTVLKEDVLRPGDTLIVTELDRLGRNKHNTMEEISYYKEKQIRLMVLELPTTLMDLSTLNNSMAELMLDCINNMMLELYASIAQAETEKREKRQREGIAAKKARGEWADYGRPRKLSLEEFSKQYERVKRNEIQPCILMQELGLKKSTYYKYKTELENMTHPSSQ